MKAMSGLLIIALFGLLNGCATNSTQSAPDLQTSRSLPTGGNDAATFAAKTY